MKQVDLFSRLVKAGLDPDYAEVQVQRHADRLNATPLASLATEIVGGAPKKWKRDPLREVQQDAQQERVLSKADEMSVEDLRAAISAAESEGNRSLAGHLKTKLLGSLRRVGEQGGML